ncbi:unnamed protein product [Rhodiola kirilowii]
MESRVTATTSMTRDDLVVVLIDIVTESDSVEVPLETGEEVRFVRVKPDTFDFIHVVHGKFYTTCRTLLSQLIDQGHIVLGKETATVDVVNKRQVISFWIEIGIVKESVEMVSTTLFRDADVRVSLRISDVVCEKDVLTKVFEKWKTSKQFVMECDKADAGVGLSPPADVIKLELYDHQKQGLRWMIDREEWPDSDDGSELPPFWEEKDGLYRADLCYLLKVKRPQMIRGGILADESGMGKTLTLLSLIAYTIQHSTTNSCVSEQHVKKKQKVEKNVNLEWRPTLVVCPPSVLATWKEQIGKCTWPGSLKVSTYHGKSKTRDPNLLRQHDIVLTTYNIVVREEESDSGILNKIDWWRVVLDDVHVLKSYSSRATTPFFNLKAKRRWAVTGKPLKEDYTNYSLYPSMALLHVHPYCHKSDWEIFASDWGIFADPAVLLLRFEVLMGIFSLRRKMPARFIQNYMVVLSKDEQDLYDSLEAKAKKADREESTKSSVAAVLQLWQSCNSLAPCRLSCAEITSSNNEFQDLRRKPKLLKKWVNLLQEENDSYCPVCLDQPDDAVITRCAHLFCKSCMMHLIENGKYSKSFRCPMCRRPLQKCHIFELSSSVAEKRKTEGSSSVNMSSSKVSALITMLRKLTNEKSVVLSQFRRTLELVDGMLSEAGFKIRRMDDAIDNAKTKLKIVKEFSNAESSSGVVLVTSFKALSNTPGLDLSVASNVYLMEPCWNAHTEEEALSHIHRLGIGKKEEDVNIIRLVCKNSIEEKVLEIRKMKPAYGSSNSRKEVTMNQEYISCLLAGSKNRPAC